VPRARLLPGLLSVLSWVWLPPVSAVAGAGVCPPVRAERRFADPLDQLRTTRATVVEVLRRRVPDWSPEADAVRWRLDAVLGETLDHEGIARRALGGNWDQLTEAQRRTFVQTFSALIDRAFVAALTRPDVRQTFDSETVLGPTASVMLTAVSVGAAPAPQQKIEYRLTKKRGRWLIGDVVVDRVSLVEDYRGQFARLLQRSGPDELIARLQRKLETSARY
jgi:phospholipid transport system substrate-binding protein